MKKFTPDDNAWNSLVFFLLGGIFIGSATLLINLSTDQTEWLDKYDGIIGAVATIFAGALAFIGALASINHEKHAQIDREISARKAIFALTGRTRDQINTLIRNLEKPHEYWVESRVSKKDIILHAIKKLYIPPILSDDAILFKGGSEFASTMINARETLRQLKDHYTGEKNIILSGNNYHHIQVNLKDALHAIQKGAQ